MDERAVKEELTRLRNLATALYAMNDILRARVDEWEAAARWIPVGDRLPEKNYNDIGDEVLAKLGHPYNRVIAVKFIRCEDGEYEFFTGGYGTIKVRWNKHIIAWRPLPKPPENE